MLDCLLCDGFIAEGQAHSYFEYYPFCSNDCVLEWNNLTYEEQQRYLACVRALHADSD